jgi:hypothetical protein
LQKSKASLAEYSSRSFSDLYFEIPMAKKYRLDFLYDSSSAFFPFHIKRLKDNSLSPLEEIATKPIEQSLGGMVKEMLWTPLERVTTTLNLDNIPKY